MDIQFISVSDKDTTEQDQEMTDAIKDKIGPPKTYTFHTDDSHGWLQVPLQDVKDSGIKVSRYSYQDETYAYLEEDCDCPRFLDWLGTDKSLSMIQEKNQYVRGSSPIRNKQQYKDATQ